jgi:hypothetical protein
MDKLCTLPAHFPIKGGIRSRSVIALLSMFLAALALDELVLDGSLVQTKSACGADKPSKASASSKSATKTDAAEASDDDDDVDLHLSALVVPERFSSKYKDADKLKFSNELRGLLLEGLKDKGDSLEAARKHFESANRLPVIDPRAPYAYGVVLLAQNKTAVALEQFRVAARQRKVPYLPALQALAWTNLSRGDHAQALPALLDLAKRLEESQETWPAAEDKENSAEWLGRTLGFLTGPGKVAAQGGPIDKLAADVASVLTDQRKQAYDRGLRAAAARHDEMKAQAARPAEELAAEANKKREEIVSAAALANREAKRIEDELGSLKKAHDKQLAELAHQVHDNAMKVKTSKPRISAAEDEVEELSSPKKHASVKTMGNSRRQTQQKVIREENAGEKKIRESQLASAQKKLENIKASLAEAEQAVADAKKQRDDEQDSFRKETAPKRQALRAAQQTAAELSVRAREAEKGPLTAEQWKARVTALESYVPLYPELEKNRLLASLKSSP